MPNGSAHKAKTWKKTHKRAGLARYRRGRDRRTGACAGVCANVCIRCAHVCAEAADVVWGW